MTLQRQDGSWVNLKDRWFEGNPHLVTAYAVLAMQTALSYAANPDPQLRMTKELLTANAVETDLTTIQRREQVLLAECWKSPEHAEAVSAFIAKRPPVFRPG